MARRAIVYRAVGDAEIAGAIMDGMVAAQKNPVRSSDAVRRVAMAQHTPEEWDAMITQARYDYGQDDEVCGLARVLLVAWAMVWMEISFWFGYLRAVNRGEM